MTTRLSITQHTICTLALLCTVIRNTSAELASWFGHSASLIRDSIYIEGGYASIGNWSDGEYTHTTLVNPNGLLAVLDLSVAFEASNYSHALQFVSVAQDTNAPHFVNAAMFTTEDGFILFGGQATRNFNAAVPSSLRLFQLQAWPYDQSIKRNGTIANNTFARFEDGNNGVYQGVTMASSVSVPGRNLGFQYGGMQRSDASLPRYPPRSNETYLASQAFYRWNITDIQNPRSIALESHQSDTPRAQAEMVWLPIGNEGALVLIGGVQYPDDMSVGRPPVPNTTYTFMSDIHIYDISKRQWYVNQDSTNGPSPGQLAGFCAVTAIAQDSSSYNIYIYGGYDGTGMRAPSDDIWVLSLPSFQWIQVLQSKIAATHGRKSHRCFTPYPNQMITVGGSMLYDLPLNTRNMFDVFDLNTLNWTGKYDPLECSEYEVPSRISDVIGGNKQGGADISKHLQALPPDLATLFKTPYRGKIPKYYPYARKTIRYYIRKVPNWLRIVIGMLVYLMVLSMAFVCLMVVRQRKFLKNAGLQGKDLGPGHSTIAYLGSKFPDRWKARGNAVASDTKLEPLASKHLRRNEPDMPYSDDVAEAQSIRTRMSERTERRKSMEEFEMEVMTREIIK